MKHVQIFWCVCCLVLCKFLVFTSSLFQFHQTCEGDVHGVYMKLWILHYVDIIDWDFIDDWVKPAIWIMTANLSSYYAASCSLSPCLDCHVIKYLYSVILVLNYLPNIWITECLGLYFSFDTTCYITSCNIFCILKGPLLMLAICIYKSAAIYKNTMKSNLNIDSILGSETQFQMVLTVCDDISA